MVNDPTAEAAVLSGIYLHGDDVYYDVADLLQPTTFTDRTNQALYICFRSLIEEKKVQKLDQVTVMSALNTEGFSWVTRKELDHVRSIMSRQIRAENVARQAAKIRKLEFTRSLRQQVQEIGKDLDAVTGEEALSDIFGLAEEPIFKFCHLLQGNSSSDPVNFGENILEKIEHWKNNPVEMVGIDSGFGHLNRYLGGGFRKRTVSFIGARQGEGKSLVALNIALYVSDNKIPVLYIDTEMSLDDHHPRAIANRTFDHDIRVTINEVECGQFGEIASKTRSVIEAGKRFKEAPFTYAEVAGLPFESILSIIRKWVYTTVGLDEHGKANDCLVIFDYFKLMNSEELSSSLAEFQELGFQMASMHNFAHRYHVPVVAFTQLNREGIKEEHGGVIRGSDRPLDLVTNFTIFKHKSADELATEAKNDHGDFIRGNCKFITLKSRHGERMPGDFIHVQKYGQYAKIKEVNTNWNLRQQEHDGSTPV